MAETAVEADDLPGLGGHEGVDLRDVIGVNQVSQAQADHRRRRGPGDRGQPGTGVHHVPPWRVLDDDGVCAVLNEGSEPVGRPRAAPTFEVPGGRIDGIDEHLVRVAIAASNRGTRGEHPAVSPGRGHQVQCDALPKGLSARRPCSPAPRWRELIRMDVAGNVGTYKLADGAIEQPSHPPVGPCDTAFEVHLERCHGRLFEHSPPLGVRGDQSSLAFAGDAGRGDGDNPRDVGLASRLGPGLVGGGPTALSITAFSAWRLNASADGAGNLI